MVQVAEILSGENVRGKSGYHRVITRGGPLGPRNAFCV